MPGSVISKNQKNFLDDLFKEPNLAPSTKKSEQCSVNMHGQFYLKRKVWNDGMLPNEEDLLGMAGGETNGGEPLAHFHVTWSDLHWARIDSQPNERIKTAWRIRLCRDRNVSTEEVYFYAPDSASLAELIKRWPPDSDGWIAF